MVDALHEAYVHGLPYPMLSVLEYFSLNQDYFDWGRHYRVAGHYTHAAMVYVFLFYFDQKPIFFKVNIFQVCHVLVVSLSNIPTLRSPSLLHGISFHWNFCSVRLPPVLDYVPLSTENWIRGSQWKQNQHGYEPSMGILSHFCRRYVPMIISWGSTH